MDRPLNREVVEVRGDVAYIAKPSIDNSVQDDGLRGVRFPLSHLFRFDTGLWDKLISAYESRDASGLNALWQQAEPLPL